MKFANCFLLLLLFFSSIVCEGQDSKKAGASTISYYNSREYFKLSVSDDPRIGIDTFYTINMTDPTYLSKRRAVTQSTWGNTYGISISNNLTDNVSFTSGFRYAKAKQKILLNEIQDPLFLLMFSNQIQYSVYEQVYSFLEIPLGLTYNFWGNDNFRGSFFKRGSFYKISAGLSFSLTTHKPYYFHYLEHSAIKKNVGLNGHLSFAYRKEFLKSWFVEVGANARITMINNYVYAPVKSNYLNYGIDFKLGRFWSGKPIRLNNRSLLECLSFNRERNFILGVSAGANYSYIIGPDRKANFIVNRNFNTIDSANIISAEKKINAYPSSYAGMYAEYFLTPTFTIVTHPVYSVKGMLWNYSYTMNNGGSTYDLKHKLKVKLHYLDVPIGVNFRFDKNIFSIGLLASVLLYDDVYEYKFSDQQNVGNVENYFGYTQKNRVLKYFGTKAREFNYGYYLGYTFEFNKWAAFNLKIHQNNEVFKKNNAPYRFNLLTTQAGVTMYLYRKNN